MFRFLQIKGFLGLSEGQFKDCELNISYHQPLMYELFEEEFLFNLSLKTLRSDNDEMCMLFASTTLERGNSVLCLTEVGDRPSQLSNWVRFLSIARLPPFTYLVVRHKQGSSLLFQSKCAPHAMNIKIPQLFVNHL